tara:strand:+ start:624 stop:767 length:144 start_codon:yes stop_codon:yes gene_type:complete
MEKLNLTAAERKLIASCLEEYKDFRIKMGAEDQISELVDPLQKKLMN